MIYQIDLNAIGHNPWQTRIGEPDQAYIKELALDIAANGLLQTPMGRKTGDQVELAFGHNRLAAFRWLDETKEHSNVGDDFSTMPVDVRELTDEQMSAYAWSENERHKKITPLERSVAIEKRLIDFDLTHEQLAEKLGISRAVITNALRLLKLPERMRQALHKGEIAERTALALVSLYDLPDVLLDAARIGAYWDLKPDRIEAAALEGTSSDEIRNRVYRIVVQHGQSLMGALWPLDHEFEGAQFREARCSECSLKGQHQKVDYCYDRACYRNKQDAWFETHRTSQPSQVSPPAPAPVITPSATPAPVSTSAAPARVSQPAPKPEPEPEPPPKPKTWEESQVQLTVTWWPGREGKRTVIIGTKVDDGAPKIKMLQTDYQADSHDYGVFLDEAMLAVVDAHIDEMKEAVDAAVAAVEITHA